MPIENVLTQKGKRSVEKRKNNAKKATEYRFILCCIAALGSGIISFLVKGEINTAVCAG
jgi:hypothetical protein